MSKRNESENCSIIEWIVDNGIRNEKSDLIEFRDHPYQYDILRDVSPFLCVLKAAQIGMSTIEILKNHYDAKMRKMDIIYCVDMETEILTRRGFVHCVDLSLEDKIITLDLNGDVVWSRLKEIFRKKVRTTVYRYKARNFDAVTTDNHRWIVQGKKGKFEFMESKDLHNNYKFIPKRIPSNPTVTAKFKDEYVELLAWIFSEGYYCKQPKKRDWSIIISQSEEANLSKCEEIRRLLRLNGVTWKEHRGWHGMINFRFAFELGRKIKEDFPSKIPTPEFAAALTRNQCRLFIEAFTRGDGWEDKSGTIAIAQKDRACVDVITMIAALGGYAPSVIPPGKNGAYTIRMTQFDTIHTSELKPSIAIEDIEVWCPRTDAGTFYARRNGRCYWTGNTLPTDADAKTFVDSKVNRIIANNPCMQKDTKDHDTVEKKKIGDSMVYFRGTWTDKAAIMITADRLVHDEKDSSKQSVVADYQARLQHSKYKQIHVFSHPSVPNNGVDIEWQLSDMKEWFITCPHCLKRQYLSWDTEDEKRMSVDLIQKCYVCKFCRKGLSDSDRRKGKWIPRKGKEQAKYSGYHVSLLMSPIHSAQSIIDKWNEVVRGKQTADFFYNKVLGLPYTGSGNAVTKNVILGAVTKDKPDYNSRIVIGVDTGLKQHYVYGTRNGIYGYGQMDDFMPDEINKLPLDRTVEYFLKKFDNSIMVIDVGGEIIQSRKLRQKYPGRVFLCHYVRDRKTMQLIRWGEGDESGNVLVDRNRVIQLVIDEFKDKRIKLFRGDEDAYYDYWLHWSHIYRTVEEDKSTQMPRYIWTRNDADHLCIRNGAEVQTKEGLKKIEDIKAGDHVWTRSGLRRVNKSGMTSSNATIVRAHFSDGTYLDATPNHPVFVEGKGFIQVDSMIYGDMIWAWKNQNQSHSTELSTGDTHSLAKELCVSTTHQEGQTVAGGLEGSIRRYGSFLMERFLKGIAFIIRITIPRITTSPTWNVSQEGNIRSTTTKNGSISLRIGSDRRRTLRESEDCHTNGAGLRRVKNGIVSMLKRLLSCLSRGSSPALNVGRNQRREAEVVGNTVPSHVLQDMPQEHGGQSIRTTKKDTTIFVRLERLKEKQAVYNLSVEKEQEYFANGILVHNCHATVYFRTALDRFAGTGSVYSPQNETKANSYAIEPDETVDIDMNKFILAREESIEDWRN